MSFLSFMMIIGLIIVNTLVFTTFSYMVILFLSTMSSTMVLNSVYNTLIGFLAGIYMPIGEFTGPVAVIIKCFPLAQTSGLIRGLLLDETIRNTFSNAPESVIREFKSYFGIEVIIGKHLITQVESLAILLAFGFISLLIAVIKLYKTKRK